MSLNAEPHVAATEARDTGLPLALLTSSCPSFRPGVGKWDLANKAFHIPPPMQLPESSFSEDIARTSLLRVTGEFNSPVTLLLPNFTHI